MLLRFTDLQSAALLLTYDQNVDFHGKSMPRLPFCAVSHCSCTSLLLSFMVKLGTADLTLFQCGLGACQLGFFTASVVSNWTGLLLAFMASSGLHGEVGDSRPYSTLSWRLSTSGLLNSVTFFSPPRQFPARISLELLKQLLRKGLPFESFNIPYILI